MIPEITLRLADKQAIKQKASFWAIKQAKEELACLLACSLLVHS